MWEVSRDWVPFVMLWESFILGFLMFGPRALSPFVARKICHTVSGLCMLLMGSAHWEGRVFVYIVSVVSLAMTWELFGLKAFWFGRRHDVGITIYLLTVVVWFALEFPVAVLAPVFFADPAGAVVGKFMTKYVRAINPPWIDKKTIFGSVAVLIVTYFTVYKPDDEASRWTVAICATLAEAVSGSFDNLLIAGVVVIAWSLVK